MNTTILIFYTYLIGCILFYIFLQLNYIFSLIEEIEFDSAFGCIIGGLIASFFWPIFVICALLDWMDGAHYKHKHKYK